MSRSYLNVYAMNSPTERTSISNTPTGDSSKNLPCYWLKMTAKIHMTSEEAEEEEEEEQEAFTPEQLNRYYTQPNPFNAPSTTAPSPFNSCAGATNQTRSAK
jgi:hypothetical protein